MWDGLQVLCCLQGEWALYNSNRFQTLVYKLQAHFVADCHLKCVHQSTQPLVRAANKIKGNEPFSPISTSIFWLFDTVWLLPLIRLTRKEEKCSRTSYSWENLRLSFAFRRSMWSVSSEIGTGGWLAIPAQQEREEMITNSDLPRWNFKVRLVCSDVV